jgi:two-component system response regulator DesR
LQRLLEPTCEIVGRVTDGAALLDAALVHRPDLVIVDLRLPKVNGIDACRRLRLAQPTLKILVLSAEDDPHIRARVVAAGGVDFVPKRAVTESLLPAIQRAISTAFAATDNS